MAKKCSGLETFFALESHYVIENKRGKNWLFRIRPVFAREIVRKLHKASHLLDGGFGGLPFTS